MQTKKTDLWTFQDDITTSLQVEQYIQSEYPELKQRSLNPNKQSAIINDVSIIFGKNKKLAIKIIYNGEKYVSREPLTKENIEYLCSLANTNQFKIDEIIGSKIKFSQINENSLLIKEKIINSFH